MGKHSKTVGGGDYVMNIQETADRYGLTTGQVKKALGLRKFEKNDTELTDEQLSKFTDQPKVEPEVQPEEAVALDEAMAHAEEERAEPEMIKIPNAIIRLSQRVATVYRNGVPYGCREDKSGYYIEVPADMRGDISRNLIERYGKEVMA